MDFYLAQINTARMKADISDPVMSGFVQRLDEINALADTSEGFVWRFQTDYGDATGLRPLEDKRIIFNLSVWKTLEDLRNYVYCSRHVELLKSKARWFTKIGEVHGALWWIQKGHTPSVDEAIEKLRYLIANGPSPDAFTFTNSYPKPSEAHIPTRENDKI